VYRLPDSCYIRDSKEDERFHFQSEGILVRVPRSQPLKTGKTALGLAQLGATAKKDGPAQAGTFDYVEAPPGAVEVVRGSSWGTFTIACTIPIALFVGLYMYKVRKGKVVEASLLGASGVLVAVVVGKW